VRDSIPGDMLFWISSKLHLPSYSYLMCLNMDWGHLRQGHQSYLLGKTSTTGWWYYFPVAALVKTPTATLLLFAISLLGGIFRRRSLAWRALPFECYALAMPAVVFIAVSMASSVDIGLRHILPVYPLLYVFLSSIFVASGRGVRKPISA